MATVKYCANCAQNKKSLMDDIPEKKDFYAGFTVCFKNELLEGRTKCPMCGQESLVDTGITEADLDIIADVSNYNRSLLEAMVKLHSEDIIEYELKMSQFRNQHAQQPSTTTKCPRCGGTAFTPMKKKWSLLAGFATNKVELVCNNCGYKMKTK